MTMAGKISVGPMVIGTRAYPPHVPPPGSVWLSLAVSGFALHRFTLYGGQLLEPDGLSPRDKIIYSPALCFGKLVTLSVPQFP